MRDFTLTRNTLIEAALRKIGAVMQGGAPTTAQYAEAIVALNSMVKSWQSKGVFLWSVQDNTGQLTVGNNTLVVSHPHIIDIEGLSIDGGVSLTRIPYSNFVDTVVVTDGKPTLYAVRPVSGALIVYFDKKPDKAYSFYYVSYLKLKDFLIGSDSPDFPSNWFDALIYGLAFRLSAEYGVPLDERMMLKAEADEFFIEALTSGRERGSVQFMPAR